MKFNLLEITTTAGVLYFKQNVEEKNGVYLPLNQLNECFTGEECEFYLNYLYFKRLDKCVEYGDLITEDEVFSTKKISIRPLTIQQYSKILLNKRLKSVNFYEEVQNIINKGISKEEANKILQAKTASKIKNKEEKKYDDSLDTFYKVFGDLFQDDIPTR